MTLQGNKLQFWISYVMNWQQESKEANKMKKKGIEHEVDK